MVQINIKLAAAGAGFEAVDEAGRMVRFDTSAAHGGLDQGVRPMQSLLMALGTCSGVDIMSILKKKRLNPESFHMIIDGEREQGKIPALWERVHIAFVMTGGVTEDQLRHAVALSIDKYCSVAETLRRAGCTITWNIKTDA